MPLPVKTTTLGLVPGVVVQWHNNGWRFGTLIKAGPKWATVLHLNTRKKIAIQEIERYESSN